jgi:hypothetical protein
MPEQPEFLSPAQARAFIPGRPSVAALSRWARKGFRRGDQTIRLNYSRAGKRMFFRPDDIEKFQAELKEADEADAQTEPPPAPRVPIERTPSSRQREIDAARNRLDAARI